MFIRQILTGNIKGSAKTILEANILGHSCGRVCPTSVLCEGACVLNGEGKRPVLIGRLQRHAVDHVLDNNITLFTPGDPNGKRVALIGGGPASLSCAFYLRREGYETVIYDAHPEPGGLNTYGIAAYKMRANESVRETGMIRKMGVTIKSGGQVGKDVPLAQLEKEFDAIFIGIGLGDTEKLGIEGESLEGSMDALTFIEQTKVKKFSDVAVGKRVAVIGGGNTAIDVATAAKRLGSEDVYMIYRRGRDEMSAFDYEYDLAQADGVKFIWQTAPKRILGNGRVETLECVRTQLGAPDASGRRSPVVVPNSEFALPVDMVVRALGQMKKTEFLQSIPGLKLDHGKVSVTYDTMQTSNPKYFAGGDCVSGAAEVVDAVADGKRAAAGIHSYLTGARRAHA
jgi:glutamate synthase (NADPH/NADH) small chain